MITGGPTVCTFCNSDADRELYVETDDVGGTMTVCNECGEKAEADVVMG